MVVKKKLSKPTSATSVSALTDAERKVSPANQLTSKANLRGPNLRHSTIEALPARREHCSNLKAPGPLRGIFSARRCGTRSQAHQAYPPSSYRPSYIPYHRPATGRYAPIGYSAQSTRQANNAQKQLGLKAFSLTKSLWRDSLERYVRPSGSSTCRHISSYTEFEFPQQALRLSFPYQESASPSC